MAIVIQSTKDAVQSGIKILLYGASGSGKTRLTSTLPGKTIILSAEAGLLSLRDFDIDSITVNTMEDLKETYKLLAADTKYDNIVLDSLSEITEVIFAYEVEDSKNHNKAGATDKLRAYGEMAEKVIKLVKAFRDLAGKNIIMIAKIERDKDEMTGMNLYRPSFPGAKLAQNLPYLFDQVFALRVDRNAEGEIVRYLQCSADNQWSAKDRSGSLAQFEEPNMTAVFTKISGKIAAQPTKKEK